MRLILACAATLGGILLGDLAPLAAGPLLLTALLSGTALGLAGRQPAWRVLALVACCMALGAARARLGRPPPAPAAAGTSVPTLAPLAGSPVRVRDQPVVADLARLRQPAEVALRTYLPEPQASLAVGVLLGGTGGFDPAFKNDLQRSGLSHVVAIDGFKQVVVAAAVGALARAIVGVRLALVPTLLAIAGYTLLTGAHASAVRAGLMVALASLATLTGRVADPLTSLLLAVTLMAALQPDVLLELGLQLSVSATLGIVLLWPRIRHWLRRWPRPLAEPIGLTLAVTLASLPVTLNRFQVVSLISPLAHVLAVPLLPLVLVSASVLAVLSPLPWPALLAAWLVWLPTTLLAEIIQLSGQLPDAALSTGRLPLLPSIGLAAVLLGWGLWYLPELAETRRAWRDWRGQHAHLVSSGGSLVVCIAAVASCAVLRPDGQLHVQALRLDRGQAVFIRGPTGRTLLLVAGPARAASVTDQLADQLAPWEHKLAAAVAVDAAADQALAATLDRYPADEVVHTLPTPTRIDAGGASVEVRYAAGRLEVSGERPTSGPPTSAARPGSGG